MARSAKKCEKNQGINKEKLKKAIEQGNMEGAKIYAQNVIREKNQALNFLRLGSRIDAVASRLETAIRKFRTQWIIMCAYCSLTYFYL
jgi:charged multivesicular body protein 1